MNNSAVMVPLDLEVACAGTRGAVDESIRNSIEASFTETLAMMQRNKEAFSQIRLQEHGELHLQNPFSQSEDKMETAFSQTRAYSKKYDDKMLRPAGDGEKECASGKSCECLLMAVDGGQPEHGFTGVVYDSQYQKCLLCIRVETMMLFYKKLINNETMSTNILPFSNLVNKLGEYTREVCIHPNGRNNICAPFVIHQRHMYRYAKGKIEQLPTVNFCTAQSSDDNG